jgi:transposase-like protein
VRDVYRAIDQFGQVIDVFVSRRRDITAARRFLERAIGVTKVMPVVGETGDSLAQSGQTAGSCERS